jgi:uncharacterized membrane protein
MKARIFTSIICAAFALNAFANDVGVIDTKGKFSDIDKVIGMVKALGHKASILPENKILSPTGLTHYDCIILSHRNGSLTEPEYKALVEYVEDGGTLLVTGLAAYWMNAIEKGKRHRRIAGEGPLKSVTGIRMTGSREAAMITLKRLDETPLTAGLPETFALKTSPPYDVNISKSWRGIGVFPIKAVTAKALVEVATINKKGEKGKCDLLTVNSYGQGKCIWLACRLPPIIKERKEKHITKIFSNILKNSELKK